MMLIMRMTVIVLLATSLQISASSYSQKVTIVSKDISLEKVLHLLKQQTGYSFLCNREVLEKVGHLELALKNASLAEALQRCFSGRPVNYAIKEEEKIVFIEERKEPLPQARLPILAESPPGDIFGRVTNEKGDGLAGVSVLISGRPGGGQTDSRGYFKIRAEENDSLVFSFIGYEPQHIAVKKNSGIIEVNLKPIQVAISEVVVVGYGRQKKASVVGAISTVNADELQVPGSQLSQSFAGQIAGVIAVQNSGEPGKNGASFWIRGVATPGNTAPLVFLDGVEISIADLNNVDPVNIENFSILKDASATALYGARGANGVILIATKRGRNLAHPIISVLAENSFVSPTQLPKFADAITFMKDYNEAKFNDNPNQPPQYTQAQIDGTQKGLDPIAFPNVDWYKTLFRPYSLRQHANVNIRGGSRNARYYMGMSYYRDEGVLKNQPNNGFNNNINDQRYNFINNLTVDVTKTTEAELSISADFSPYTGPATKASDIFAEVMNTNPVHFPVLFPAPDTANHPYFGNATGGFSAGFPNPYADMVKGYVQSFTSTALSTLKVNQKLDFLIPGLSANFLFSFKNYTSTSITRSYTPYSYVLNSYSVDPATGKYSYVITPHDANGQIALGQTNTNGGDRTVYMQGLINYEKTFGAHNVSGMVVYQQKDYSINIPSNDIVSSLPHRNQGVSGRVTYAYDSRYFLEGDFGYTGSENFSPGHKYGFFPSVGVGYLISNEAFFDPLKNTVTTLKLRASRGLAGNDQISTTRFPYTSVVNLNNTGNNGNGYTFGQSFNNTRGGVLVTRYPNPDITWERSDKENIGLDLELWHHLTLTVDVFKEVRSNIFQQRVIPSTLGIDSVPYANIEKVQNKGIDLSLAYTYTVNKDLSIGFRGTFTYARNKVLVIDEPKYPYPYRSSVGRPVNQLRGLIAERLFTDSADIAKSPAQYGVVYPGDIKYKDVSSAYDKNSLIDDNDKVPMGHPAVPEITYGFGFTIQYKKFDLKVFFQGIGNTSFFINGSVGTSFVSTKSISPFGTLQSNLLEAIAKDHWSQSNPNPYAFFPRLSDLANPNDYQSSSWWLRSGAFCRLKDAEIGYAPNKIVRVYLSGFNLLTFSKFKLWDPELSATTSSGNGLGYPPQRVVNVGIQLSLK
ncbi:MAG TPA: TonB-dependent receptor [Puia sp.]|nr:TonB-dependent receptor [Puia sp.]